MQNYYFVSYMFFYDNGRQPGVGYAHVACDTEFEINKCIEYLDNLEPHRNTIIMNWRPVNDRYILINSLRDKIKIL